MEYQFEWSKLWTAVNRNAELEGFELAGFHRGSLRGKTMDVSLDVLKESLRKQWSDLDYALKYYKPEAIKGCIADLRNVAGCLFLKLQEIEAIG